MCIGWKLLESSLNQYTFRPDLSPMNKRKLLPLLLLAALSPASMATESASGLREAAQRAVLQSPEVTAKWHAFKAAEEEIGVARGGYLPQVDLTAGRGKESLKPGQGQRDDYTRTGAMLTLNQMLFDGFATRNDVRRLSKARLVRYYELLEASENTALEAARAYLDVLRYRELVRLAEDNYVQHKATHEQVLQRTQSGVGRRVDLEQAGSRLALAEVNLSTEIANLHDVSARYQRLVGILPPASVVAPGDLSAALPASSNAALAGLYRQNPTLLAAIENTEAAQYDVAVRRAAYSPRVDLRASTDNTRNYLGADGRREHNVAEVVFTWNLFRGGSDRARERQYMEQRNVAFDLREKACRDTRQTLLIAYNDVQRLRDQKGYLATQVKLLERTLAAYRDQFNIGQRTLLDLLDTENELLSARRNAIGAEADYQLGILRTHAGMGALLQALGLQKLDVEDPAAGDLATVDAAQLCPADVVTLPAAERAALDARAKAMLGTKPAPLPVADHVIAEPLPKVAAPSVASGKDAAQGDEASVLARLKGWAEAWMTQDFAAYNAFYAPNFVPGNGLSRADWEGLRRNRLSGRQIITVELENPQVSFSGAERALLKFRQIYRSDIYRDVTQKTLEMVRTDGRWLIVSEISVPCAGNTVGGCL
jgi:adhesin transport system outer membrane protein